MSAPRPCPGCSKPVARRRGIYTRHEKQEIESIYGVETKWTRRRTGWEDYRPPYDPFCTLRCALEYARYMFREHGTQLIYEEQPK